MAVVACYVEFGWLKVLLLSPQSMTSEIQHTTVPILASDMHSKLQPPANCHQQTGREDDAPELLMCCYQDLATSAFSKTVLVCFVQLLWSVGLFTEPVNCCVSCQANMSSLAFVSPMQAAQASRSLRAPSVPARAPAAPMPVEGTDG